MALMARALVGDVALMVGAFALLVGALALMVGTLALMVIALALMVIALALNGPPWAPRPRPSPASQNYERPEA